MANNKKTNTAPKQEQKKAPKNKAPQNPPVEEVQVEEVATAVINGKGKIPMKGLSPDSQVTALNLLSKHCTGTAAAEKYGVEFEDKMDRIVAVGIVSILADHAVSGNDNFALTLRSTAYPMLLSVAKDMGITLPEQKALPPSDGNIVIPANEVTVSEEAAAKVEEEQEVAKRGDNKQIELDPKKVAELGEDALKEALQYLFITKPKREKFTVKDTLTSVVDFMHDYRIELARKAENSTEAMNKFEDRTMYEWLTDIRQFVKPTMIAEGIGKGLISLISIEKSPLSAFLTLRKSLIDKETKVPVWDDQSIADATRFFVDFICESEIAKETKAIEGLDPKKDEKVIASHQSVIDRYSAVREAISTIDFSICEKLAVDEENKEEFAIKTMNRIKEHYYPQCENNVPISKYVGLEGNIRQRAGIILNMFVPSDDYNKNYSETNLVEVTEMPLEDWQKLQDEKKAQAVEERKKKAKNA